MSDGIPLLVLNGPLRWTVDLAAIAASAPFLVAADGGADALARIGIRPDVVVGDLDSISPEVRQWVGENRLRHHPDQDRTDFEKALEFAFSQSDIRSLIVLGALGGRLDHTIGNLGVLAREARGNRLVLVGETERVLATRDSIELVSRPGETWSFWTFDPSVRVTIDGVRWPVVDAALTIGGHPSISNEATGERVRIRPEGGGVVVSRIVGS